MNIKLIVDQTIADLNIDTEKLEKLINTSAGLNSYRHEATNYDELWGTFYNKNLSNNLINKAIRMFKNAVNELIVKLVEKVCRRTSNVIKFPTKTQSDWTVQYVKSGMTVDKAELLAASKVENAKLRAKGAAAKAARKARLLKVV